MKYVALLALAVASLAVAACDDSPTDPSSTLTFTAQLAPANEVPPVSNAEASGSGTVTIVIEVDRDNNGSITDATANFQVTLTGFPASTALTMAHIHSGASATTGPIVVDTGLMTGEVTLTSGAGTFVKNDIDVPAATATAIEATPSAYYFNVHSMLNGNGVARGQLVRQ